jgi:hypothetical protein
MGLAGRSPGEILVVFRVTPKHESGTISLVFSRKGLSRSIFLLSQPPHRTKGVTRLRAMISYTSDRSGFSSISSGVHTKLHRNNSRWSSSWLWLVFSSWGEHHEALPSFASHLATLDSSVFSQACSSGVYGALTCGSPSASYCESASLEGSIIFRCTDGCGTPGNCNHKYNFTLLNWKVYAIDQTLALQRLLHMVSNKGRSAGKIVPRRAMHNAHLIAWMLLQ